MRTSAAIPATRGDANEVPEPLAYASVGPLASAVEVTSIPGAAASTQYPEFENQAASPAPSVAATATSAYAAG